MSTLKQESNVNINVNQIDNFVFIYLIWQILLAKIITRTKIMGHRL